MSLGHLLLQLAVEAGMVYFLVALGRVKLKYFQVRLVAGVAEC
jgi:hypothetical protein